MAGAAQKSAVLVGASGLVGGFCLRALLEEPAYARIVLLNRRALPLPDHPKLTQKTVNFEQLAPSDFQSADDIFCALGTTIRKAGSQEAFRRVDLEYPLLAAKLAHEAGARQFVLVSSIGADPASKNFYLRTKGELEQELAKLGFRAVHIFRPSLLLDKREEFRLGERVMTAISPLFGFALVGGLRKYRPITAANVGAAMVAAAAQEKTGVFRYEHDQIVSLLPERNRTARGNL